MDLGGDLLTGAGGALVGGLLVAGLRWLVAGKAKQLDGLPVLSHQIQMELVKIGSRLDRAEADIANDKAGRRAFAAVENLVGKISSDIGHLAADVQKLSDRHEKGNGELWSAINRLRDNRDVA